MSEDLIQELCFLTPDCHEAETLEDMLEYVARKRGWVKGFGRRFVKLVVETLKASQSEIRPTEDQLRTGFGHRSLVLFSEKGTPTEKTLAKQLIHVSSNMCSIAYELEEEKQKTTRDKCADGCVIANAVKEFTSGKLEGEKT